jgi:hypothetical protein
MATTAMAAMPPPPIKTIFLTRRSRGDDVLAGIWCPVRNAITQSLVLRIQHFSNNCAGSITGSGHSIDRRATEFGNPVEARSHPLQENQRPLLPRAYDRSGTGAIRAFRWVHEKSRSGTMQSIAPKRTEPIWRKLRVMYEADALNRIEGHGAILALWFQL